MAEQLKFNYVIGRRNNTNNPNGSVGTYMYGNMDVFYGTMEDAVSFQHYCNAKLTSVERKSNPYHVYKLVELPDYK